MLKTLREKWFWYSIASAFCFTAFQFSARFMAWDLPVNIQQFVSAFGLLGFGIVLLASRGFRVETNKWGVIFGILAGVLLGIGGLALYAALRTDANASVITTTTSLYPICTVLLAVLFLRERLTKRQLLGLAFAAGAIVSFSI
jgi:transporter family protein